MAISNARFNEFGPLNNNIPMPVAKLRVLKGKTARAHPHYEASLRTDATHAIEVSGHERGRLYENDIVRDGDGRSYIFHTSMRVSSNTHRLLVEPVEQYIRNNQ